MSTDPARQLALHAKADPSPAALPRGEAPTLPPPAEVDAAGKATMPPLATFTNAPPPARRSGSRP